MAGIGAQAFEFIGIFRGNDEAELVTISPAVFLESGGVHLVGQRRIVPVFFERAISRNLDLIFANNPGGMKP